MGIPRQVEYQVTSYLRRDFSFATANIAGGVLIGTVPSGARICDIHIWIDTAFNAGTTNVLQGGTTVTGSNLFTSTDSAAATVGEKEPATGAGQGRGLVITQDQDLFLSYTQTGTAATAGAGCVVVEYVPLSNGG